MSVGAGAETSRWQVRPFVIHIGVGSRSQCFISSSIDIPYTAINSTLFRKLDVTTHLLLTQRHQFIYRLTNQICLSSTQRYVFFYSSTCRPYLDLNLTACNRIGVESAVVEESLSTDMVCEGIHSVSVWVDSAVSVKHNMNGSICHSRELWKIVL